MGQLVQRTETAIVGHNDMRFLPTILILRLRFRPLQWRLQRRIVLSFD